MIITRTHTPAEVLVPPKVGAKYAARHLKNNSSRFRHLLASVKSRDDNPPIELPFDLAKPQLAISVEQNRIRVMPLDKAMEFHSDDYRFTARLALETTLADIAAALDNGALPYVASLQVQVRRVNQMSAASHPATAWDLNAVFRDMDEDARAIFKILADAKARNVPCSNRGPN